MPQPRRPTSELLRSAAESCQWLVECQNKDGSWGSIAGLDKLICTCHVTMTLLVAGLSPRSECLERAVGWLISPAVREHNNSYWMLGPLAAIPGIDASDLTRELRRLEEIIRTGAKPHPNQIVEAFYLRALANSSLPGDPPVQNRALDDIVSAFDPDTGWSSRADSTTDGYSILYEFLPERAAEIRSDVITFLKRHANIEGDRLNWGSEVSTAYCIMNIASSDLSDDETVKNYLAMAIRWLQSRRIDDVSWKSEPPYGGVGDLKSPEYPTAVVVRALLAGASLEDPYYQVGLADQRAAWSLSRARRQRKWLTLSFIALLVMVATPLDELVFASLSSIVALVSFLLGIPLALIGFYASVNPDDAQYMWRSAKRRLRGWRARIVD